MPHFGQLADAMQDGHASIKIFTTNIRPGNLGRMVPHGHIWEALKVVAARAASPASMPRTTTSSCSCTRS